MKTIAFFNNKGGVGKTTLCFHLAHMMGRLGKRILVVDLDPQANLTAYFMDEEQIEELWAEESRPVTVSHCLGPLQEIEAVPFPTPVLHEDGPRLALLPGNVNLGSFEDLMAQAWLQLGTKMPQSYIRTTIAFHSLIRNAAADWAPDAVLVDVGPNLGGVTRAALLASDLMIVPLAADVFSLQGLRNLGPTIDGWRRQWQEVRSGVEATGSAASLPAGEMRPVGYVLQQHVVRKGQPTRAFQRMFARVPDVYREAVLRTEGCSVGDSADDPNCLGQARNYQSLVPLSQDAHKPIFDLRPGDGAIGAHQAYVQRAYENFRELTEAVVERCKI